MILRSKIIHEIINRTPIKKLLAENRFLVRVFFNYQYRRGDPYNLILEEQTNKIKKAFCLVDGFKAKKALEIGCGEGKWSHYIAALSEKVIAFDISDTAIKKAKEIHQGNTQIEYRRADLVTENFSGETYDFIFCSEVLIYFELSQLNDVIPKIVNLLNPKGKLLLVHVRSLKDDSSGIEFKEFGAKTIHEAFIRSQQLELEKDIADAKYRITLLRRK
jgi:2-polyprenyl-3-methyl-5-hydroxy-6-metoxy-1,4-benzoquinol methylase